MKASELILILREFPDAEVCINGCSVVGATIVQNRKVMDLVAGELFNEPEP